LTLSHSGESLKIVENSVFGNGVFSELDYALKRLINGVISSSAVAQINFSLCFG
jgi:hypothetical protein